MNTTETFLYHQGQTSDTPYLLEIEKAEGLYLYDKYGKKYIDLIAGVSVSNIGHRHPKVIEAIQKQLDKHLHVMVYGEYIQEAQVNLADKLKNLLPEQLNCSYFVNSGTEANEAALKLAKRVTGRTKIVSCNKSYHGSTHGSLSVSGNEYKKQAFRPLLPDVHFMDFNQIDQLNLIDEKTACVIIEPIQGDAGIRIPSQEYMTLLRNRCTQVGALLIFDEIQSGFGRTGKFFAFEHFNTIPDILTIAKAMGGGMPIGAFISSHENMEKLTHNPMLGHITTFGGHPVNCAAASATIDVLIEEQLIEQVEEKGTYFEEKLSHTSIIEIRRKGLFFAIEMVNFETVSKVVKECMENGLIGFWFLSCNNSFRIAPPLTITYEEIDISCKIIQQAFDKIAHEN